MSREKRLMREVQRMRDEETHDNPTIPYRRTVIRTRMWWPIELMRQGKTQIIFQYLAIWAGIILIIGVTLFFLIRFILLQVGWWHWI